MIVKSINYNFVCLNTFIFFLDDEEKREQRLLYSMLISLLDKVPKKDTIRILSKLCSTTYVFMFLLVCISSRLNEMGHLLILDFNESKYVSRKQCLGDGGISVTVTFSRA